MRISDWSSDVCSSDLTPVVLRRGGAVDLVRSIAGVELLDQRVQHLDLGGNLLELGAAAAGILAHSLHRLVDLADLVAGALQVLAVLAVGLAQQQEPPQRKLLALAPDHDLMRQPAPEKHDEPEQQRSVAHEPVEHDPPREGTQQGAPPAPAPKHPREENGG